MSGFLLSGFCSRSYAAAGDSATSCPLIGLPQCSSPIVSLSPSPFLSFVEDFLSESCHNIPFTRVLIGPH